MGIVQAHFLPHGVAMRFIDYTVLITFDLHYAKSSDYDNVNKFLTENKYETLSHKGNDLPNNTYLGKITYLIDSTQTESDGAVALKDEVYSSIKRNMKGNGLESVVFVLVAPANVTTYSCSNPSKY